MKENRLSLFSMKFMLLFVLIAMASIVPFHTNAATLSTDVSVPASGNVFIGLPGSYVAGQTAALKRINAIRYEACKEGVINPSTGEKMTLSDYNAIKWSADLEQIARIRAAESSLTMQHIRTNGSSCFEISSDNISTYGEVLAWGSTNLVDAVNLWYTEKSAWVHQTGGVTGHYTSMIDPENRYVGLGGFLTSYCSYKSCMAGEFNSSTSNLSSGMQAAASNIVQIIEIPASKITALTFKTSCKAYVGASNSVYAKISSYGYAFPLIQASWNSSNPSIVSVDQNGNVYFHKKGTAIINATVNGRIYSLSITVTNTPTIKTPSWKSLSSGKKKITVKWKKISSNASGYQIQYSTNKKFSSAKTITISNSRTISKVIKNLKSKKNYYVRLRTYYKCSGKNYYSKWSGSKRIKVK